MGTRLNIVITIILTALVAGVVVYMLHGLGQILMVQDKKDEETDDDV
jgi:hypothetical protein